MNNSTNTGIVKNRYYPKKKKKVKVKKQSKNPSKYDFYDSDS